MFGGKLFDNLPLYFYLLSCNVKDVGVEITRGQYCQMSMDHGS